MGRRKNAHGKTIFIIRSPLSNDGSHSGGNNKSKKLALIKEHPNLGDRVQMSENSVNEQENAGLNQLTEKEYKQFIYMNQSYMDKFGFPFILAVRGKTKMKFINQW